MIVLSDEYYSKLLDGFYLEEGIALKMVPIEK